MRRIVVFLALLALTCLPAAATSITLSPPAGPPGLKVKVTGNGFAPSSLLQIEFDATSMGEVTANGHGAFTRKVTVPTPATAGDHVIVVRDLASGLAANETFTVRTDWAMLGRDPSRTSYNPQESELGASLLNELVLRASFPVDGNPVAASPVMAGGSIYVADIEGVVHALNVDGTERWRVTLGGPVFSSPAVGGQVGSGGPVVFVGSDDGKITALNGADGALKLTFATGGPVRSSPLLTQDVLTGAPCGLFVGSDDGNLYALNCTTGLMVWSFHASGAVESSPAVLMNISLPGRTKANVLTFQSGDGNAYGLNAATGALLWSYATGGGVGSPAMAKPVGSGVCSRGCSRAFLGSASGIVFALDAGTGAPAWTYDTGSAIAGSPAVAPFNLPGVCLACTAVYIGNQAGSLFAFDATNGNLLWRTELGASIRSAPAVGNGLAWVHGGPPVTGEDGSLVALDATTGAMLKTMPLKQEPDPNAAPTDSAPVLTDQSVLALSSNFAPIGLFSDWPMFRHDPGNTGYNDKELLLSSANIGTLILSWSNANPALAGTPAVAGHTMWIHAGGFLTAADVTTPSIIWQIPLGGGGDTPALYRGRIIAVDSFGVAKAFPAQCNSSCQPLWQTALFLTGSHGSPIVNGSTVYVDGEDSTFTTGSLVALDAVSGSVLSRNDFAEWESSLEIPAVGDGLVFFKSYRYEDPHPTFQAVDGFDVGSVTWEVDGDFAPGGRSFPVYSASSQTVLVDYRGYYYEAYPASCVTPCRATWGYGWGTENWSPLVIGSTLYVMHGDGLNSQQMWLQGIDMNNGSEVSQSRHFSCSDCGPDSLAGASDLVFVGTMEDSSADQLGLAVFQAGCDGALCPYLFIGPSPYVAVGQIAVAGGRVFVPACPSDSGGNCVGATEMKVYSTY